MRTDANSKEVSETANPETNQIIIQPWVLEAIEQAKREREQTSTSTSGEIRRMTITPEFVAALLKLDQERVEAQQRQAEELKAERKINAQKLQEEMSRTQFLKSALQFLVGKPFQALVEKGEANQVDTAHLIWQASEGDQASIDAYSEIVSKAHNISKSDQAALAAVLHQHLRVQQDGPTSTKILAGSGFWFHRPQPQQSNTQAQSKAHKEEAQADAATNSNQLKRPPL